MEYLESSRSVMILVASILITLSHSPSICSEAAAGGGPPDSLRAGPDRSVSPSGVPAELAQAGALIDRGQYDIAEVMLREALREGERSHGPASGHVAEILDLLVQALVRGGKGTDAEPRQLAERALRIKETSLGPKDPGVARSLNGLAGVLLFNGDHKSALPLLERATLIWDDAPGAYPLDQARTINALANALRLDGKYANAEPLYERALAIREKELGPEGLEVAATLDMWAILLRLTGSLDRARSLCERALAIRENALGPDHIDVASSLFTLATVLRAAGNYSEALPAAQRAVMIREKSFGTDHLTVANPVNTLANIYRDLGDLEHAKPLFERALAIREKALGPDDLDVAMSLNNLANLLRDLGRFDEARPLHERALAIREKTLPPDHPDVTQSLRNLARLLTDLGEYERSHTLLVRALVVEERRLGPEHVGVAATLFSIATLYRASGDYVAARQTFERVLEIREKAWGPGDPRLIATLSVFASILEETSDYGAARSLYEKALRISEGAGDADLQDLASLLNNYGILLHLMGDRDAARASFERALTIREKIYGADHLYVAETLSNYGAHLKDCGELTAARPLFERAISIKEHTLPANDLRLARTVGNLAGLFTLTRDYSAARALYERSLAMRESLLGPNHVDTAWPIEGLANLASLTGEHDRARELYERALVVRNAALDPRHPDVTRTEANLAAVLLEAGDDKAAFETALRAEASSREHLRLTAGTLPERQALDYESVRSAGLDLVLFVVSSSRFEDPKFVEPAWNAIVRSRAVILDEVLSRQRTAWASADTQMTRLLNTHVACRRRLAELLVRGPEDGPSEAYRSLLEKARKDSERAEAALVQKSAEFRGEIKRRETGLQDVLASLPSRSALVSFVRYENREPGSADKHRLSYVAFVSKSPRDDPLAIPLGEARGIDSLVANWRRCAGNPSETEARLTEVGMALRVRVWDPIAPHLKKVRRVFVVPDGSIHIVNMATLPIGKSKYLIETGPTLHYVSAERDLVSMDPSQTVGEGILAIGGVDYDATEPFAALRSETGVGSVPSAAPISESYRGLRSACPEFSSLRFEPLPASMQEVENVASMWKRVLGTEVVDRRRDAIDAGADVLVLKGKEATESAFKQKVRGRSVLHLATHGFFVGEKCHSSPSTRRGVFPLEDPDESSASVGENPLRLSGLVLAGANHREMAGPDEEDGILTAEEVSSMDLRGVEWAVLSACETGLGELRSGEGVFGFRRAFKQAGVATLIMSLWPVGDEPTEVWMTALYEHWIVKKRQMPEVVREAGLEILNERRKRGDSTSPYYWGSFVASGAWH